MGVLHKHEAEISFGRVAIATWASCSARESCGSHRGAVATLWEERAAVAMRGPACRGSEAVTA